MINNNERFFPTDPLLEVLSHYDNYYRLKNIYVPSEEDFYKIKEGPKLHICKECKYKYEYFKTEGKTLFKDQDTGIETERGWEGCTRCDKAYDIQALHNADNLGLKGEERNEYITLNDPVKWLEANFACNFRFYQKRLLQCSAKWQIWRVGRRSGKSHAVAGRIIYGAYVRSAMKFEKDPTKMKYTILVITATRSQILSLIDSEINSLLSRNTSFHGTYTKCRQQSPYGFKVKHPDYPNRLIEIKGFCAGEGNSTSIRSQGADEIYLDEADFIPENAITSVITPIITETQDTLVVMSSTTSGARSKFWEFSTTPTSSWVSHHFRAIERPADLFTYNMYQIVRLNTDRHSLALEYDCVWGEPQDAVFDAGDITRSIRSYALPVKISDLYPDEKTIIGIDWNGSDIGNHIVIVGYSKNNNTYRLLDKIIFRGTNSFETSKYSELTREKIIEVAQNYKVSTIYCDQGAGTTDIEELRKYCKKKERASNIKIIGISMQGNISWKAPDTNHYVEKDALNLLVKKLLTLFENGRIILPKEEDYKRSTEIGLVGQIRSMKRDKISGGKDVYKKMYDHTLVAFYVAVSGHHLNIKTGLIKGIEVLTTDTIYTSSDKMGMYKKAFEETPIDILRRLKDEDNGISPQVSTRRKKRDIILRPSVGIVGYRRKYFERILDEKNHWGR